MFRAFTKRYPTLIVVVALLLLLAMSKVTLGDTIPAIHWINDSSQSVANVLSSGSAFTTDFKGTNDVTLTQLGWIDPNPNDYINQNNDGENTVINGVGNNPSYLTGFVGSPQYGTGNGTVGVVNTLWTTSNGTNRSSYQFDFAQGFTPNDRLLIFDVDGREQYQIQAYVKNGAGYSPVSVSGWTVIPYTGKMGTLPNSSWATWDPNAGTFTSNVWGSDGNVNSPLDVLIPSQSVDRVVITETEGEINSVAGIQFVSVPEPSTLVLLGIGVISMMAYAWRKRRS